MDPILYWNDVALEANRVSHSNGKGEQTGPTLSSRALAVVHLAMYDAFAGVTNSPATLPLYLPAAALPPLPSAPAPAGAVDAAVAAAAHATLSSLFPSQRAFFDSKHLAAGLAGVGLAAGHAFGLAVAAALIADRAADDNASGGGHCSSMHAGGHRPDPDNPEQGYHGPRYGSRTKLFATTARLTLNPPPATSSPQYLTALREVRGRGIAPQLMGTVPNNIPRRTVDQTLIGLYWGYDGAKQLGTPPRLYNQIVKKVAVAQANDAATNARLFAFVNAAMADAGILAWAEKYKYDLWRPVVGIREHDHSMGPAGGSGNNISNDCDPAWLPLGAPSTNSLEAAAMPAYPCQQMRREVVKNFTPPFPAYPSGHATFGAAALHVTRRFYGVLDGDRSADTLFNGQAFTSEELDGVSHDNLGAVRPKHSRSFAGGLWDMILENGESRVFLGVHWVFDAFLRAANGAPDLTQNVGGVPLGLAIAENIFTAGNGEAPKKSTVA
jgi:membrane-associated phospholipid phosphatase